MEARFNDIISKISSNSINAPQLPEIVKQFKNSIYFCNICMEKFKKGEKITEKEEKIWVLTHIFLGNIYPEDSTYANYKDNKFLLKHFPRYYLSTTDDKELFELFPQLYIEITSSLLTKLRNIFIDIDSFD